MTIGNCGVTSRSDRPGYDIGVTENVEPGRAQRYGGIAFATLRLGFVALAGFKVNAIAPTDHGPARTPRIVGKTEARSEVLTGVVQLATLRDAVMAAFHEAVAEIGEGVEASGGVDVAICQQGVLLIRIVLVRQEPGVDRRPGNIVSGCRCSTATRD